MELAATYLPDPIEAQTILLYGWVILAIRRMNHDQFR